MKKFLIPAIALTLGSVALPAAAQGWQNINARQANLDTRIDQGVRQGTLTRAEAVRLRADFQTIGRIEADYRRDGLSNWERADLDRRFDALSARIRYERADNQDRWDNQWGRGRWRDNQGQWMNINQRQAQLDRRIDMGLRTGRISRQEANRLRNEFRDIARMEVRYRADGLSQRERADLDRRFDVLSGRIQWEANDRDNRRG
jgi:hypothetical protein